MSVPGRWAMVAFLFAAAAAGCGGGKGGVTPGNPSVTPGNPSNNTSVCAYTKRVGSVGRVYVQMAVTPVSLEPATCSAFNGRFGGRRIPPVGRMGTGHVYCGYSKSGSSYTIKFGVFASSRATGLAFCRSFPRAKASGATCERADITIKRRPGSGSPGLGQCSGMSPDGLRSVLS